MVADDDAYYVVISKRFQAGAELQRRTSRSHDTTACDRYYFVAIHGHQAERKKKHNNFHFFSYTEMVCCDFFCFFFCVYIFTAGNGTVQRRGSTSVMVFFFFLIIFFVGCCLSPSTILLRLGRDSVSVSVVRCLRVRLGCASIQTMPQSTNIFLRRIFRDCFLCCSCFIFAVFVRIVCLLDDSTYFHLSYGLCLFPANGAYAHLIL